MARTANKTNPDVSEELVNLLKQHRLAQCKTLEKMAQEFGVSTNAYRQWEEGKASPRLSRAKTIAATLGVRLSDVIRFIEPSYRAPVQ